MALTCKDILVIHLQILNEDLVNDYYRGLIHSDRKQYFLNVNKVNRSINSFRANNFSFDINLMHASIYAGGFSNVYFLKRMQIYLHNIYPFLKDRLTIQSISQSFQSIWSTKISKKYQNHLKLMNFHPFQLPILQKIIIIKSSNKHFDFKSHIFWMSIFCMNHNFFEMVKSLLNTRKPLITSIYRWFNKEIKFRFNDYQKIENIIPIFKFYTEKLNIKSGERFALSYDAMKFTPGIQRTSKNGEFFGFTTIYHRQGQIDILKVIEGKESPKDFLQSCCLNNLIGDYLFLFYVSSLDHKDVREFPIHVVIKKNGFSDRLVHIVKRKIIKDITSCGYYIPYTFSDGDGLDQQFQNKLIDAWLPKLIKNFQSIEKCELILNNDCFYNFQIQSDELEL